MNEFNNRLDSVEKRVSTLEERTTGCTPDSTLMATIEEFKSQINERDQNTFMNDIEVSGIAEQTGENLMNIIIMFILLDQLDEHYVDQGEIKK